MLTSASSAACNSSWDTSAAVGNVTITSWQEVACHQKSRRANAFAPAPAPWNFIRIQQRNGRIDRYGQLVEPQITALALTSDDPQIASDLRVVTKLLQKEHAANLALGDAGLLPRPP